jgi:metallophosphoesterase (TIGR00282 family)
MAPEHTVNAVMVGDVVGPAGLRALFALLPSFIMRVNADIVVANGENAQRGFGIGPEELDSILSCGVDVVTTGNHVWEKKDAPALLASRRNILRPANYPPGLPGTGVMYFEGRHAEWVVINLQGRLQLYSIDCPFRTADEVVSKARREYPKAMFLVDFHAESPEEKEALGWYLDGRVSAVAGTHTHVQTADERLLPKGTGYITDLGMAGPIESVIGMKTDICIKRSLTQIPFKMETSEGEGMVSGAVFSIDPETRCCVSVQKFSLS